MENNGTALQCNLKLCDIEEQTSFSTVRHSIPPCGHFTKTKGVERRENMDPGITCIILILQIITLDHAAAIRQTC